MSALTFNPPLSPNQLRIKCLELQKIAENLNDQVAKIYQRSYGDYRTIFPPDLVLQYNWDILSKPENELREVFLTFKNAIFTALMFKDDEILKQLKPPESPEMPAGFEVGDILAQIPQRRAEFKAENEAALREWHNQAPYL
jgi:hypothetical protein